MGAASRCTVLLSILAVLSATPWLSARELPTILYDTVYVFDTTNQNHQEYNQTQQRIATWIHIQVDPKYETPPDEFAPRGLRGVTAWEYYSAALYLFDAEGHPYQALNFSEGHRTRQTIADAALVSGPANLPLAIKQALTYLQTEGRNGSVRKVVTITHNPHNVIGLCELIPLFERANASETWHTWTSDPQVENKILCGRDQGVDYTNEACNLLPVYHASCDQGRCDKWPDPLPNCERYRGRLAQPSPLASQTDAQIQVNVGPSSCGSDNQCPTGKSCDFSIGRCGEQRECFEILKNGPPESRINVVIIGSEFGSEEELKTEALEIIDFEARNGYHGLMSLEPFKASRHLFNFWGYLSAVPIRIDEQTSINTDRKQVQAAASRCRFKNTPVVLSRRDFRSFAWRAGEAYVSAPRIDRCGITLSFEGVAWVFTRLVGVNRISSWGDCIGRAFTHEFGHSFASLADEYTEGKRDEPAYPNCAPDVATGADWWGRYAGLRGVSFYNGCSYTPENIRPTENSVMRHHLDLSSDFGPVNEHHLKRTIELQPQRVQPPTLYKALAYHLVARRYLDGTITFEEIDLAQGPAPPQLWVMPGYHTARVISDKGEVLHEYFFHPPTHMVDPFYEPPNATFDLGLPYFFDAASIAIYDPNNTLRLTVDVTPFKPINDNWKNRTIEVEQEDTDINWPATPTPREPTSPYKPFLKEISDTLAWLYLGAIILGSAYFLGLWLYERSIRPAKQVRPESLAKPPTATQPTTNENTRENPNRTSGGQHTRPPILKSTFSGFSISHRKVFRHK